MALDPGFVAYEGYRAASDGKSLVSGAALPPWHELGENIRVAWRGAADVVLMMEQSRASGAPANAMLPVGHEPVIARHSDNTWSISWPEGRPEGPEGTVFVAVTPDLLERFVESHNELVERLGQSGA